MRLRLVKFLSRALLKAFNTSQPDTYSAFIYHRFSGNSTHRNRISTMFLFITVSTGIYHRFYRHLTHRNRISTILACITASPEFNSSQPDQFTVFIYHPLSVVCALK